MKSKTIVKLSVVIATPVMLLLVAGIVTTQYGNCRYTTIISDHMKD